MSEYGPSRQCSTKSVDRSNIGAYFNISGLFGFEEIANYNRADFASIRSGDSSDTLSILDGR